MQIIKKLTKMVQSMEEEHFNASNHTNKQKLIKRNVQKAMEYQENAIQMAKKQNRISQQFESLVNRLETESVEKAMMNTSLRRQLQTARVILKDEAGVDLEEVSLPSSSHYSSPSGRRSSKPNHQSSGKPRSVRSNYSAKFGRSESTTIHPITEIAFSNTVVDVTELACQDLPTMIESYSSDDATDTLRLIL